MNKLIKFSVLLLLVFGCSAPSAEVQDPENATGQPTLEEMIGQMIMVGFRGFTMEEVSPTIKDHIRSGKVGSIILFDYDVVNKEAKRNIESPEQVQKLIAELQSLAPSKLLVAVDQEGGKVNRLKSRYGFPESVSNKYLGDLDHVDSTRFYAKRNALTLSKAGFNVNFSPDVDLNINEENPVIGKIGRSYGRTSAKVIKHASIWIEEHNKQGILSTLKHFPGHGSSHSDSHYGLTDITNYWSNEELVPFEKLTQEKGVGIMTAHVVNNKLDTVPATLSPKIIKNIVRDQWKFDGLIFSDDLHMGAVNDRYNFDNILQKSILAGVDILVYGNNLKYDESIPDKVIKSVSAMVKSGKLSEERIKQSYLRIMKAKDQVQ